LTCDDIYTEEEKEPKRGSNRNTKGRKRKNTYKIATWNVRSMYEGKLDIVQKEMNRIGIDILGISKMKWIGSGHFRSTNYTVLYSGHSTHKKNGVGMIITNQMWQSLRGYKAVNDRTMCIRLEASPVNITCVQVYAPTISAEVKDI
jgi:exonuclease III